MLTANKSLAFFACFSFWIFQARKEETERYRDRHLHSLLEEPILNEILYRTRQVSNSNGNRKIKQKHTGKNNWPNFI